MMAPGKSWLAVGCLLALLGSGLSGAQTLPPTLPPGETIAPETLPTSPPADAAPSPLAMPPDVTLEPDQAILKSLMAQGYFNTFPDNLFHPEAPISRAEFVTLLYRASGITTPFVSEFAYFRDMPTNHWAYLPVEGFRIRHMLAGSQTGFFYPESPITRQEAGTLLSRSIEEDWLHLTPEEVRDTLHAYKDIPEDIPENARLDVARSVYAGFLTPSSELSADGQTSMLVMGLSDSLTRMDAARMVHRRAELDVEEHRPRKRVETVIPSKLSLNVSPSSAISKERLEVGQSIYFALVENTSVDSINLLLPRGTRLHGQITTVSTNHEQATLQLDKAILPSGAFYKMSAKLSLSFPAGDKESGFMVPGQNLMILTQPIP